MKPWVSSESEGEGLRWELFRRIKSRMGKCPRRMRKILPGLTRGSRNLPWDVSSIQPKGMSRLGADAWGGVGASAKAVDVDTGHGIGGSGIAGSLAVCVNCGDGRRLSGSVNDEPQPRVGRSTPRRSRSGGGERRA